MVPDTAPVQRPGKVGNSNVLVDCFMRTLAGPISEGGRQMAVGRSLRWNTGRKSQKIKWKEAESRGMSYENLQRRKKLIRDTVKKTDEMIGRDLGDRVKGFGSSSTVRITVS